MSKVSGPVSMYYLKPISNDMPIILLFGDHHFSYDNMCNIASSDLNGRSNEGRSNGRSNERRSNEVRYSHKMPRTNELEIYSPIFLKQLDNLSTPSRPVDFYVEYFDDTDNGSFDSPLDKFTEPIFQPCYKRTMKKGSRCPAPNIRWHYSDIRLSKMKNNIEYIFDTLYVFSQFCKNVMERGSYEGVSLDSWKQISDAIHRRNMKFSNKLVEQLRREKPGLTTPYKILDFYRKCTGIDVAKKSVLRKIIRILASANLVEDIVELIFSYTNATTYPSLIYKQFMKQDQWRIFSEKDFIVSALRESLGRKLSPNMGKIVIGDLLNFDIAYNREIDSILLHINSTFVDLYTILRMMKKIDTPPALCVGYFGNMHVTNLVSILLQTGYYNLTNSVKENRENRCLPFDIDLRKDLVSLNGIGSSRIGTSRSRLTRRSRSKLLAS